uniref:Death domain-containing protein n=1 Tax=Amphimedon queenslandica TaxID=400682 RepID=A0A1X7U4G6_AMPQE
MATSQTCSSLDISELGFVLELLEKCCFSETKWYKLGLRLGLRKNTLDLIEKNHPHDVSRCMTECLSQWLGRADNVDSRGGANLDSLSDALGSMNETAVAEKLKHQVLIDIFNNCQNVLSQSLCDPFATSQLLYGERMLRQEAVSRVVSASPSIPNQREALLTAVKEAVQTDPNSLHTFANVLCTISTNVSLGQTILDDISKYFPTPKVGMVRKGPSVIVSQVGVPVPKNLLEDFSSIRVSYARMFFNVCNILENKLKVAGIKKYLSYYTCSASLRKKLDQCSDISGILYLVKDECSLTNIVLLCSIVEEMEITEAEEHIEKYKTQLKEFCKSLSISLCLEERFSSIPHLQCQTLTLLFDWEPEEHLLKDILELLAKVSGKLLRIEYIERSHSICVTCSFPFSDVGFTVLRMIENIHILMGQGLKKLTIGNLTLWRRQDVREKELKEKDQDLLQHTEVISYIILEETEYKLRNAISSKEKESIQLKQEIKILILPEEEPLYEELTVLRSQFNEIKEENKELSDKILKMKIEYLRSLTSNTDSAACRMRRGMTFEIDDCKFHLKAMTRPDYQPLVDNKRIIEKLQERITLMNMELITEREHKEKIIKDIKDHLKEKETETQEMVMKDDHKDQKDLNPRDLCIFQLFCVHPVIGDEVVKFFKVHKDELLPSVLDKAYELMELAPHIPIERCRLVKYNPGFAALHESFDLDEYGDQTIGHLAGGTGVHISFGLLLEIRKENGTFKKYNAGGIYLKVSVVDLSTGEVEPAVPVRGERGWTVGALKQHIGEVFNINLSCMRLVRNEYSHKFDELRNEERLMFFGLDKFYVSSDPKDYQKKFKDSLMYRYIKFHNNSILLNITLPPGPETIPTTTNIREGEIMIMISMKNKDKGKERKIQVRVSKSVTLAQLKEELVPLIGVQPSGFRMYRIGRYGEYEIKELYKALNDASKLELRVRLGRALEEGEKRVKLYLLQVNNTKFCKFMMESIVTKDTPVGEFKKQIIEEAKVQGIDCVLELDKMRLRYKIGVSPGGIYLDHERIINASMEMYVEPLKGPEKKKHDGQRQVYVIRWRPSQCSVDPIEEIILDNDDDFMNAIGIQNFFTTLGLFLRLNPARGGRTRLTFEQ